MRRGPRAGPVWGNPGGPSVDPLNSHSCTLSVDYPLVPPEQACRIPRSRGAASGSRALQNRPPRRYGVLGDWTRSLRRPRARLALWVTGLWLEAHRAAGVSPAPPKPQWPKLRVRPSSWGPHTTLPIAGAVRWTGALVNLEGES